MHVIIVSSLLFYRMWFMNGYIFIPIPWRIYIHIFQILIYLFLDSVSTIFILQLRIVIPFMIWRQTWQTEFSLKIFVYLFVDIYWALKTCMMLRHLNVLLFIFERYEEGYKSQSLCFGQSDWMATHIGEASHCIVNAERLGLKRQ